MFRHDLKPRKTPLTIEHLESRQMLDGHGFLEMTAAEVEEKIADYKSYFDTTINREHNRYLTMAETSGRNGWNLYNLQLPMDGVLSMYEATGDVEVLDRAIEYTTLVMESAHVIENGHYERDGFLDWEAISGGRPQSKRWGNMLYDFQYGSMMSRLARIIHEDPTLAEHEDVQEFGDRLTHFVDEQIVFKWLDARGQRDWLESFFDRGYWSDKATHITTLCNNMTQIMGAASSCDGAHLTLGEQFKNLLVVQDDGVYLWGQYDPFVGGYFNLAPDTNHENRVATMISQLGADNVVFDETDIEHLGKTFTERIWNRRTDWEDGASVQESPWFHNYIDGSDEQYRNYIYTEGSEGMNGFIFDGWVRLGEFVPEVQEAGDALLSFVRKTPWNENAIRLRNGSAFGKIALSGHLAKNLRVWHENASNSESESNERSSAARTALLPGDANRDGEVTFADFLALAQNFGNKQDQVWASGDFTGDGRVDMTDFLLLAANFTEAANG